MDKEDCLILQKAINGLVQAARQFWKKIVDKIQEGGFQLSKADSCMLYREDESRVCIIIIYIDDMLIIGKEEAIDDAVKVLQSHFHGASMAHGTEMYRVINFVLETKTLGLKMVPIFKDGIWKLEALSDSDFANDKDTRCSVYGYIIYFCDIPVAWKSKSMKSVVLSTTEA